MNRNKLEFNRILYVCMAAAISFSSCSKTDPEVKIENKKVITNDSVQLFNLTENQKKILAGAKKCLDEKFKYDVSMAYHTLNYKDGINTGSKVFPGGDIEPDLGVCTEVTIRSLRYAGIVDLQEAINKDINFHWSDYHMDRWDAKKTDSNIDHRRVPNQNVWFKKYWNEIKPGVNDYMPGDVIIWDMDKDSWGDHIGIVSDKVVNGEPYLIHNFPSPGYVAEENVLNQWKIIGHFRIKN